MTFRTTPPDAFLREVKPGSLEVRTITPQILRATTAGDDGEGPVIEGYCSVFNQSTTIGNYYRYDEEVAPSCWTETIAQDDIRSMFNHDTNWLLGRNTAGTLDLLEDDVGLFFRDRINTDDMNAMSVHAQVKRGDVTGASVWFRVIEEHWTEPDESNGLDRPKRRIIKGKLYEGGPVVFPAFEQTSVTARSLDIVDQVLRTAGVNDNERRAQLAVDLLADPAHLEPQLRSLFAQAPDLRDAVCSCRTSPPAPPEDTEAQRDQRRFLNHHEANARGLAARYGLTPSTTKES